MRLPSIEQASREAAATLRRFPFVLLVATVAAVATSMLIARRGPDEPYARVLLPALLGVPLLVALATTMERRSVEAGRRLIVNLSAMALLALLYVLSSGWTDNILLTRYVHLDAGFHLLAATLPFAGFAAGRAFWHYNRIIFLRFLLATLYTFVLFAGLAVALLALDKLFNLHVDEELYAHLLVFLSMIFHPWFFLGGVPRDIGALDELDDYPAGLKIFAQFILIPVVTVYVAILTAYLVKVVATTTWPSGWIGWLVSSVAAAGTLALLLVHPVRERTDSRWVDAYGRWFFVLLLPSVAMLLLAIWKRVDQYGFTEQRYFLGVLALWLAGIALYYAVTGSRNIRLIPVTLCIVALVTFPGPWSAYGVSQRSQANRLAGILERNGMLSGGQISRATGEIPFDDAREISATMRYLVSTHGPNSLRRVSSEMATIADSVLRTDSLYVRDEPAVTAVMDRLGVDYVNRYQSAPQDWITFFARPYGSAIDVAGYDYTIRINITQSVNVPIDGDTLYFSFAPVPPTLTMKRASGGSITIPLTALLDSAYAAMPGNDAQPRQPPGPPPLQLEHESNGMRVRLRVWNLSGRGTASGMELNSAEADVLVAIRK